MPALITTRRHLLKTGLAGAASLTFGIPTLRAESTAATRAEQAHTEIWRRFIDKYNVMIDFTDLDGSVIIPTPEECKLGKPNALGWWSPIENGPMFNGLYMDAAVNRWKATQDKADAEKARKLAEGLIFLASLSEVKGFIGRGVSTDGKSHYAMGSNDQTLPWFFGLWRYLDSGLATEEERQKIIAKLVEASDAIIALKWHMPAEPPFNIRGSFNGFTFDYAPRYLFVCKMMAKVTNDQTWKTRYEEGLHERGGTENASRLDVCEKGLVFEHGGKHSWTASCCVAAIRCLWEMEDDQTIKAAYARGLEASANLALESLPITQKFNVNEQLRFEPNWRLMNETWVPQTTEKQAQELAQAQLRSFIKLSPQRQKETSFVREPVFAAWIVTMATDKDVLKKRAPEVEKVIAHYDYTKLTYSQFFPVESAWWRLQAVK